MAIAGRSYNPGFLTDDELRTMFCVRVGEFESLVETLRENSGASNQHVIVIGPRGSGKTTLLLRVALEVRSDPDLSSRLYPIVFAEESYSVSTCGELWLECLTRLARQARQRAEEPDLRRTLEDVRQERNDRVLRERCLGVLLDFAEREGKRRALRVGVRENAGRRCGPPPSDPHRGKSQVARGRGPARRRNVVSQPPGRPARSR